MHQLKPQYAVVFEVWMHLKVVHIFVESVLQYGLPDMDAQAGSTDERGRVNLASHYIVGFFRPKDAKSSAACVKHLSKVCVCWHLFESLFESLVESLLSSVPAMRAPFVCSFVRAHSVACLAHPPHYHLFSVLCLFLHSQLRERGQPTEAVEHR